MEASTNPPQLTAAAAKVVAEAKKKFSLVMEDELLDYKHNNPVKIEGCASTLIKIFSNIIAHPEEDKYHKVKATSNTFKINVSDVRGGEHLCTLAGFKTVVVDLQKYWVFEVDEHNIKMSILQGACATLERALATIHEKAERKRHEQELKVQAAQKIREQALAAIEEDKAERRERMDQALAAQAEAEKQAAAAEAAAKESEAAATSEEVESKAPSAAEKKAV